MKLILHIGTGKTGTTSIQNFFYKNSEKLLQKGIFYPVEASVRPNHILLPAGFSKKEFKIPHNTFYMDNFTRFKRDFDRFWKKTLATIKNRKPKTVVLSAEQLFRDFSSISAIPMRDFLGQYFDSVQVVVYIRSPVSDYTSKIAQRIKTGQEMTVPGVRPIRSVLEYFETQFPNCISINAFERGQLTDGDVLKDFVKKYTPEAEEILLTYRHNFLNTSLPTSLLVKLQDVRHRIQPSGRDSTLITRAFITATIKRYTLTQKNYAASGIDLKPEISNFLRKSAIDYLWLRDTYGVTFSDLNYNEIKEMHNPFTTLNRLSLVADINLSSQDELEKVVPSTNTILVHIIAFLFYTRKQAERIYKIYRPH